MEERIIRLPIPEGGQLTVGMNETEFSLFQKIMKEEELPPLKAYVKVLDVIKSI